LATLIRNIETNTVDLVPDHYLTHPILGAKLVPADQEEAPVSTNKKQSKVEEPVSAETTTE